MDHARQELCVHPLQHAHRHQHADGQESQISLDVSNLAEAFRSSAVMMS